MGQGLKVSLFNKLVSNFFAIQEFPAKKVGTIVDGQKNSCCNVDLADYCTQICLMFLALASS